MVTVVASGFTSARSICVPTALLLVFAEKEDSARSIGVPITFADELTFIGVFATKSICVPTD